MRIPALLFVFLLVADAATPGILPRLKKRPAEAVPSKLDKDIASAEKAGDTEPGEGTPGSLWSPSSHLSDLGRDLRASQRNDLVTVVVSENVNAVATGVSTTQRTSSATGSVSSLAGKRSAAGALANLAGLSGDQKLNGTGTTSRTSTLTATLTARVVRVLPGGLLVIEGEKAIQVNSEQQSITVRGIVRSSDIQTDNTIASTLVADLEVRVNGKGLVADAVRRPNILYRLLLGLLPF